MFEYVFVHYSLFCTYMLSTIQNYISFIQTKPHEAGNKQEQETSREGNRWGKDQIENKQDRAVWFLEAGRMLQKYFESETLKKGKKNHAWLGHCEGRHHMFSGMHFLLALQAEPAGAVAVATQVEYVLHQAHTGGGLTPRSVGGSTPPHSVGVMPEECTERLLTAADGEFPTSLRCGKNPQKQVNRMSSYNAMDFGRFVIAWLCSCRNVQVPLTPHIFDIMQSCQAAGAKLHGRLHEEGGCVTEFCPVCYKTSAASPGASVA